MWTVVYMSKNEGEVARLKGILKKSAVISMMRKRDDFFEILVPSAEVSLAHRSIIDVEI